MKSHILFILCAAITLAVTNISLAETQVASHEERHTVAGPNTDLRFAERIAVVDMQKCFADYDKAKEAAAKFNKAQADAKAASEKKNTDLRDTMAKVKKINEVANDPNSSSEQKAAAVKERDGLLSEVRKAGEPADETANKKLRDELEDIRTSVVNSIKQAVADQAKEDGYSKVAEKGALIFYSPDSDITDKVIKRLNSLSK